MLFLSPLLLCAGARAAEVSVPPVEAPLAAPSAPAPMAPELPAVSGLPAVPDAAAAPAASAAFSLPVASFQLANGLTVVVQSDHASPMVAVAVTYKVGSKDERPGRSGFAHLFEHLMAQGTKSIKPREISKLIESAGGTRNAYTTRTNTTYHSVVPKAALELVLWAEAERMHTLNVDERALALEQNVVLEEMRKNYLDAPYRKARDQGMAEALFTRWENRHTTIGERADVENARLDDVRQFYRSHYAPNNAVLTLAGDVTPEEARQLVERHFGPIARQTVPPSPDRSEPPLAGENRSRLEDPFAQTPRLLVGWRSPQRGTKDFWALTLLSEIMSGRDANPLYRALVKDAQVALAAGANFPWWSGHATMQEPDAFGVIATPRPGRSADDVLSALDSHLRELGRSGPAAEDLARAKAQTRFSWLRDLEQLGERSTLLASYAAFVGDPAGLARDLDALMAVTPEDVRAAVSRWLLGAGRGVVEIVPGTPRPPTQIAERPVPPPTPRLPGDAPPAVGTPSQAPVPALHRFTLSNGLKVVLIEDQRLPLLEARLLLDAGSASEGPAQRGLSRAAADLLLSGAAGQDGAALQQAFAKLGWDLKASRDDDSLSVTAAGLAENAGYFFAQLGRVLGSPDYPDVDLALWRDQYKALLKDVRANPDSMAAEEVNRRLLAGHPYGRPIITDAQVDAVTRDQVLAFHAARLKPAGATLVLAGALSPALARQLLEQGLSSWTGAAAPTAVPAIPAPQDGGLSVVERPGSQQVNLVIAQTVPLSPADDDYPAFAVMNQILGGSATSRLFVNLRVDKGYTYGSYSSADAHPAGLVWSAEAQVRNEVAQASLDEMRKEILRMRDERVPDQTLADTKRYLAGLFSMRLSSLDRVADYVEALTEQGRDPEQVMADYLRRLDRLTPDDIQRVARKYLDPRKMAAVAVGERSAVSGLR